MNRRQRIVLAASSLTVGGGVVLLAITGTAGAIVPSPPGPATVTTVTATPGQHPLGAGGPQPTLTVSTTSGTTSRTPSPGATGGDAGTTVSIAPRVTPPGQATVVGDRRIPTSTIAPTK